MNVALPVLLHPVPGVMAHFTQNEKQKPDKMSVVFNVHSGQV